MDNPTTSRHHRELILWGLLGLAILGVFGSTLYADFVQWDDDVNIYRNPDMQGLTLKSLHWMFTDVQYVRRYMPLGWLSWAITFEWQGLNPAAYHLGNLLFHYLNAILVFVLLRKLFRSPVARVPPPGGAIAEVGPAILSLGEGTRPTGERNAFLAAAAGALLWALHPLRVEPVAWASGRIYCQATCFLLISLLSYLHRLDRPTRAGRVTWYCLAIVSYAASLLTYPIGLGLLPVLIVLDLYPLRRFNPGWAGWWDKTGWRLWLEKMPIMAVAVAVFAVTWWCRMNATGDWRPAVTLDQFGIFPRVMQGFYLWGCFLWKTWWPVDLAPLYTTLLDFNPNAPIFWANALLVSGVSLLSFLYRRRWPALLALWSCYLVLLVPVLGFTEHPHYPSDRYSYVVGIVYAAALALGVYHLAALPRWRRLTPLVCGGAVAAFALLSFFQCRTWQNSDTLFVHMISTMGDHPARADDYHRLALHRISVGNYARAEEALRRALAIKPGSAYMQSDLGDALALQGKLEEAVSSYQKSLAKAPGRRNSRLNLAHALGDLGRREEATANYEILLNDFKDDAQVRLAYAQFLAGGGRSEE